MDIDFERVPLDSAPWSELDRLPDRTVHQTRAWLEFLSETQRAEPVLLRIVCRGEPVGWFTGAVVRRFGVPIVGSPMRGWSTAHMGFNLSDESLLVPATTALRDHVRRSLHCLHLELMDRRFVGIAPPAGFSSTPLHGLELDLLVDDDQLLAQMSKHGRRDVRRALRLGVDIEEVGPQDPSFVDEYYAQASLAFAKRGLRPPYPKERVAAMVRHLHPAGHLLMLRAVTPDGELAASGIFAGLAGATASFTMQASDPHCYRWYPNEVMVWEALRRWRRRGAVRFDMGGRDPGGQHDFKRKFGGTPVTTDWLRWSRFGALERARGLAQRIQRSTQSSLASG